MSYYETDRALSEYLLLHFGTAEQILPYPFGPSGALHFPVRCVAECIGSTPLPPEARALELGCAVGRAAFELARYCSSVVAIDNSARLIDAARRLQKNGRIDFLYVDEGELTLPATAVVPS